MVTFKWTKGYDGMGNKQKPVAPPISAVTLDQVESEHRYGRIILVWGAIKSEKLSAITDLLRFFFPVEIHRIGDDAYCYIGVSPLFDKIKTKKLAMGDIPFYTISLDETGCIVATKHKVEKQVIKKPTQKEITELS